MIAVLLGGPCDLMRMNVPDAHGKEIIRMPALSKPVMSASYATLDAAMPTVNVLRYRWTMTCRLANTQIFGYDGIE